MIRPVQIPLYFSVLTFWLLAGVTPVNAQSGNTTVAPAGVKVLTRAYTDSIKLRWAPTNPLLWKYAQKYGYTLEKYLVYKSGKLLPKAQKLALPQATFRPATQGSWQAHLGQDPQVTVAYQALFGEGMPITSNNRMLKIAEKAQEQELRFAFALMAADYSARAAQLSGLSFTDKAVKKGEKYLYRVQVPVPTNLIKADTGSAYVGVDDFAPLPKPVELEGQFGDKSVLLVWNQLYYQRTYAAYYVERSEDGKNYQITTEQPYATIQRDTVGAIPTRYMTAVDSLPQNDKTYYFRIRGLTPFAELGPPSDSVIVGQGQGKNELEIVLQKPQLKKQQVQLTWKFDNNQQDKIQGFKVLKAPKAKGHYEALHAGILPVTQRTLTDSVSSGASYYQVQAIGLKTNQEEAPIATTSFPHLVQLPDSIPPDAPLKISGKVDTTGVVTLNWSRPRAKDVKGYHIFRSEGAKDEFTRINVVLSTDTTYRDSISLRTLNPDIYYKIQAVDYYFNPSQLSSILVLKRPDKTPPSSPAFVSALATDSALVLRFQASASPDVARHLLYRTPWGKDQWQLQANFTRLDTVALKPIEDTVLHQTYYEFADQSLLAGEKYQYTLMAVDSSGLESPPSRPVTGQIAPSGLYPAIQDIEITKNAQQQLVELNWQYLQKPQVKTFRVYRAEGDAPLRLYQTYTLKPTSKAAVFRDTQVNQGNWYSYRIQAIAPDGTVSRFSKAIRIKF